jgi:glycosyltransferase involved in cell wall biosynthesis
MSSKKPHIFFCTDGIFPHSIGGMQRHSLLLLEEMVKQDRATFTVIHPHAGKVLQHIPGIQEIPLNSPVKGNYILHCYNYSKKVFAEIQKYQPDLIYSQGLSVFYGLKKIGSKTIVNPHGLEPFQAISTSDRYRSLPLRMMEAFQFRHAAKVISLGGRLTTILKKYVTDKRNVVVIPNAVNPTPPPERRFDREPLQLLFVGRFASNKGIDLLLETVTRLNNDGYKNKLVFNLVGKGPLYEKITREYRLPNVNYLGFATDEDLFQLYRENDIFVFPTLFEGMPTVVLEAMMAGMPIIVSDTGATAEQVDQSNGFLVEAGNIRALKTAIQQLYSYTPEQRKALSEKSISKVMERFTWEKAAKQHLDLFESMTR